MDLLFVHQNFPGQFRHIATHFAADPAHRVVRAVEAGGAAPIPLEELFEVARVTIEAAGG